MNSSTLMTVLPLVLLLLVMYFLLIRPQKKKEKEINTMRSSIKVGDEIITIGGICAKVVKTKDETLVIQVGADKVKFEVMRWSVSKVVEKGEGTVAREEEAPKPAAKPKRLGKKAAAEEAPAETPVEAPVEAPAEEAEAETEEKPAE